MRLIYVLARIHPNLGSDRDQVNINPQNDSLRFACVNVELSILVATLIITSYYLDITWILALVIY